MIRSSVLTACVLLGLAPAGGCQIVKIYEGAALRADPASIEVGVTDMGTVLELFGAPTRIQRQRSGDVFFYRYMRQDSRKLTIEEPVLTNLELYSYTEVREDSESLVVLFDERGLVRGFGYRDGAGALDR